MSKTSALFWTEAKRLSSIQLSLIRKVMEAAPPNSINLALGELGFPLPNSLKEKAKEILDYGTPVYTPNAGLAELREAIAQDYHSNYSANNICVCNGAEEAVFITLMSLLNPGDCIAFPDPDYTAYNSIASIYGAKVKRLPFIDSFKAIDFSLWESILSQNVKIVLLSCPSNPSGFFFSEAQAIAFGEICNRYGIIVIVDEIYSRLYYSQAPIYLEGYVQHIIRIGGVSKSHCMSGWRIGWIASPLEIVASMIKAKQYVSTCSNWLSQKLAVYALSEAGLQESDKIRLMLKNSRDLFLNAFKQDKPSHIIDIHAPDASPYIMLKLDMDDLDYSAKLASAGVIVVPGRAFGDSAIGWIRVNIGVEPLYLEKALALWMEATI
ncbi:MAG: pyridoxal phosphate-dependent aminotransferase [Candidatus Cloacimonetes bacterium]|nr:pyridoxal phosphate-dependent aminotransferase [Candidatus Cloacimonadota bacterium]